MRTGYQIAVVGRGWGPLVTERDEVARRLSERLRANYDGPYERKIRGTTEWGHRNRIASRMVKIALRDLDAVAVGRVLLLHGADDPTSALRLRRGVELEGGEVLDAALSQLGVDYVWADANPLGPGGGAGAGFDCSGLTLWCYAQVGVDLPHSAEAQRTSPRVSRFSERAKLRPGDLVFYDASDRLRPGQADHVGIADGRGGVVDASSGLDAVVHRDMDVNPVLEFGRVREVNGAP